MRKLEFILLFLVLQATARSHLPNYTPIGVVSKPSTNRKIAYTKSQNLFILYSSDSNIASWYNGYLYNLINDYVTLASAPSYLIYTLANDNSNLLIYGDENGNVYLTGTNGLEQISHRLLTNIDDCKIIDLALGSDATSLAIGCQGDKKVHLYDINTKLDKDPIDFESTVYGLDWSPSKGQLKLVVGGGDTNNEEKIIPKVTIYDFSTDPPTPTDITVNPLQSPGLISGVAYSSNGSLVAYIQTNQEQGDQFVYIFDVKNEQATFQVATEANQLQDLIVNADFLTAHDNSKVYVWQLQDKFIGSYPSTLASGGVSPDGSDLLTLTEEGLQLSKICPDLTTTFTNAYEQQDLYCIPCTAPCQTCYSQAITCTSCTAAHYLDSKNYACPSCIDNCISCVDGASCEECDTTLNRQKQPVGGKCLCATGYFQNAESLCESCGIIAGCQTCESGDVCTTCDASLNREVQPVQGKCLCAADYFQNTQNLCESCGIIPGCKNCKSGDACETCDANLNRQVQPSEGKCLCATGYFEDAKNLCESCGIIPGCQTCESRDVCQTCDTAGHWAKKQDVCQCEGGYYPDAALCLSCRIAIDWCLSCTSANQCDSCINPLTFNGGKCQCQNNGDIYNPDAGTCEQTKGNTLAILLIAGGVLLVLAGGGFYLYRRIKKKKQQESIVDSQETDTNDLATQQKEKDKGYNRLWE